MLIRGYIYNTFKELSKALQQSCIKIDSIKSYNNTASRSALSLTNVSALVLTIFSALISSEIQRLRSWKFEILQ